MSFYKYIFTPKLFKDYTDGSSLSSVYQEVGFEKLGDSFVSFWGLMFSLLKYGSPIITLYFYKKGYLVSENFGSFLKISTGIGLFVVLSYCIRGYGRSQSNAYRKFIKDLEDAELNPKDPASKKKIRTYDFQFDHWPVDFSIKSLNTKENNAKALANASTRSNVNWVSPCSILAFLAIHTFGLKMIYPGSIGLIQKYLNNMLIQGRAKLVIEHKGTRSKIETLDGNFIDTMFVDNRGSKFENGKTLVICAEGNAGFYEIGIMGTPLELHFSVLGFNHPGFGGSTGSPFPKEEQNAADSVIQFAIQSLGFAPENIMLFGWSIGAYDVVWLASQYPNIKGILLDATFDDLVILALPRMPESISSIVRIAIRDYCNLNNTDLITQFNGPVSMIRRTEDEIIAVEEGQMSTNRGNFLALHMLKYRFPNIFKPEQIKYAQKLLSKTLDHSKSSDDQMCLSLIMSYVSEHGLASYPLKIGEDYSEEQLNQMTFYLLKNHLQDYKSSHCTPLPAEFFKSAWTLPIENDFVFT